MYKSNCTPYTLGKDLIVKGSDTIVQIEPL